MDSLSMLTLSLKQIVILKPTHFRCGFELEIDCDSELTHHWRWLWVWSRLIQKRRTLWSWFWIWTDCDSGNWCTFWCWLELDTDCDSKRTHFLMRILSLKQTVIQKPTHSLKLILVRHWLWFWYRSTLDADSELDTDSGFASMHWLMLTLSSIQLWFRNRRTFWCGFWVRYDCDSDTDSLVEADHNWELAWSWSWRTSDAEVEFDSDCDVDADAPLEAEIEFDSNCDVDVDAPPKQRLNWLQLWCTHEATCWSTFKKTFWDTLKGCWCFPIEKEKMRQPLTQMLKLMQILPYLLIQIETLLLKYFYDALRCTQRCTGCICFWLWLDNLTTIKKKKLTLILSVLPAKGENVKDVSSPVIL